jgi:hypothetical protein
MHSGQHTPNEGANIMTAETITAGAALTEIANLKAKATAALDESFEQITELVSNGDGRSAGLQLTEHDAMIELVESAAWLANDLVEVLQKVATGQKTHSVMRSDLVRRIQEAEVRLELLRKIAR